MVPWPFVFLVATAEDAAVEEIPPPSIDDAAIVEAIEAYKKGSTFPFPMPDVEQRARLLEGKILKVRLKEEAGDRALGMAVSTLPMAHLWIASMDPDFTTVSNVHGLMLEPPPEAMHRWYGFVDLPRPFADRHFLLTTTPNRTMAGMSNGTMWERSWRLEPDGVAIMAPLVAAGKVEGVDVKAFERAIYTPVNYGSWMMVQLDPEHVLIGYSVATVVGGDIPEGLVTQHVLMGLDELMGTVLERASQMVEHYRGAHTVLLGGDGKPIPVPP
jgi:hypothetical protein